jgi:hypothetical protein
MAIRTLDALDKEYLYRGKLRGRTLPDLAAALGCSVGCVRKWWRVARDQGGPALWAARTGRRPTGAGSHCPPPVVAEAVRLKRVHPGWGPNRVLIALQQDPNLTGLHRPSRSRLAAIFRARCPETLRTRHPPLAPRPCPATGVHECWQLDSQEGVHLGDGQSATICTIRDPVGAAVLASQVFVVTTARHWRKLTWVEVRGVLRAAFTTWQTLPSRVQTDNELCLGGSPTDPYPSLLTLWLCGLGVAHTFIRPGQPTDQAQIERTHRTLGAWVGDPLSCRDAVTLQAALDRERSVHNHWLPSRASDCAGRPPVVAHPTLLTPWRPYRPEAELALFDLQRVYDYLATIPLARKVNSVGQISVGRRMYSVGRRHAGQAVTMRMDAAGRAWVVYDAHGAELGRRPAQGLDVVTLTGMTEPGPVLAVPIQLALPFAA